MDSCSLPVLVTAAAVLIARNLNIEELVLVSSLFIQLGDTLATIAAQRGCQEAAEEKVCRSENGKADESISPAPELFA